MEKIILKLKNWVKSNPLEFWILVAIIVVGATVRLYNIGGYMTFLGDEGRDAIIVRRLLTEGHPPLIGPGTSIGNMYLGPMYYYMMAPALLLAGFSPVGPAVEIAILGIITIWFVWYVGKTWFGKTTALVAAGLYAISPTVIIYSRSSWNPNIMPFFALLSIFAIWKVWKLKRYNWLLVLGFSIAAVLQSHYLGLLLVPPLVIFWLLAFRDLKLIKNSKMEIKNFIQKSILGFGIFAVLMSPLLIFDMRHNWAVSKAIYTFFTVRQTTVSIRPWTAIPKVPEILETINVSLIGGKNEMAGELTSIAMVGMIMWLVWIYFKKKKTIYPLSHLTILFTWLSFGLIGFGIYKQNIYDHYFGFLFPVPYLLMGALIAYILKDGKLGKILGGIILIYLVGVNLVQNPLRFHPNNQLPRAINVAKKIEVESKGERFNLAVIAERNYEDGYKYFLLKEKQPVVSIDAQIEDSITNQLFVVCELEKTKCDPTHNANASVANFGWSTISEQWTVDGVQIYKLIHNK